MIIASAPTFAIDESFDPNFLLGGENNFTLITADSGVADELTTAARTLGKVSKFLCSRTAYLRGQTRPETF